MLRLAGSVRGCRAAGVVSGLSVGPEGSLTTKLQVAFTASPSPPKRPAAKKFVVPLWVSFFGVSAAGAPDGRFVDMITRLGSRMDDMLAESQSAAPREALTRLLNLSSGGNN